MPTVAIVDGVKIQFFFGDHPPAHFHVDFAGARAQIRLAEIDFCADTLRMEAEGIWDPITREWKV
jgi:hypothetical protein